MNNMTFVSMFKNVFKKIIFDDRDTIVIWMDGLPTAASCSPSDEYSREMGFLVCLWKKAFSKLDYNEFAEAIKDV